MGYKIFDLKTKSFLDDEEQEKRIKKLVWDSQKLQEQVDISREKSLASTFKQQAKPVQAAQNKPAQSWQLNSNGVKNTVTASKIPSFPKDSLQDKPKKAAIKSSPIKNDSDVLNLVQSTRKNLVQQKQQKVTVSAVRKASVANDSDILNLVQNTRKNLIQQKQQKAAVPAVRKASVANDSDILNLVQNTRENLVRQKQTQTAAAQSLSFDDLLAKETLNPAEVTAAKKLIKERKAEYQKRLSGHLKNFESISPEDQAYSMLTSQLQNKVSNSAAFSMGLMNGASFGLLNQAAKKQDAAAEALAPALQPALTEAVKKGIDSRQGKSVVEAAAAQNPAAYGAGNFAGEAAKYSAFAPIIEELPVVGKAAQKAGQGISKLTGGKVSADLAGRLVSGRMVDLPFDVINAAVDTSGVENAGERLKTIGSNVAKDQLSGLAMDTGMEALGAGYRAVKNTIREKTFRAFLDPQNISDTDIDGYLNQIHAQDGPKREKLKDLPQKRAMPILSMEKVPETKINPGARKSIRELAGNIPQEGYEIPKFNSQSKLFTDAQGDPLPVSKYPAAIQKYMVEHFKGKVLDIGPDRVFINKAGIKEFSFPVRRMQEAERLAKFSAGEHLDETLKPARFLLNVADADARHPDVTGGWDNYYVMFQVDDDIYSGIVKTKNTAKGRQFYDISEIKKEDVPPATYGVNGKNPPPAMPGTSSSPNITQRFQEINGKNRNGGVDITAGGLLPDVNASKTARTAAADVRRLSPIDRMKNGINGMNARQREAFRQEKLAKLKNIEDT